MVAGYNSVAPAGRAMSYTAYLSASLSGDLDDLCAPGMFNCTKVWLRVAVCARWGGGLEKLEEWGRGVVVMFAAGLPGLLTLCAPSGAPMFLRQVSLPAGVTGSNGHCSLLVKPVWDQPAASGPSDLLFAHTTWSGFETMTRVYKRYDMPLTLNGQGTVPATSVAFSSYPAALFRCAGVGVQSSCPWVCGRLH